VQGDCRELRPPPELAGHVACLWYQRAGPERLVHRVVPDACADIISIASGAPFVVGPATRTVATFSPIVADPAAARAFYVDRLGLAFEHAQGDYIYTEKLAGTKHFGLWPLAEAAQACFGKPVWPADRRIPQAGLELEVEDPAAAAAELVAKGLELIHPVRTEPWGQTIARLLSPDGLIVGVCHTPGLHGK
jgi:catechol 2,3-dioxygenase-like lactoylglutathione lyase family enzyme